MRRLAWLTLATAALLAGCSSTHHATKNRRIVLGRSIGGIRLGESRSEVNKYEGPERKLTSGWSSYRDGAIQVVYAGRSSTAPVRTLATESSVFHTASGIGVGSSFSQLKQHVSGLACYN